ncbi:MULTISPECIES: hypothetical protein [Rhodomicrobium]|uniref:hypothetical protein n=1 Tax=Rhodomicrobium TaxID=1068 RepID=UPI000F748DAC|nr:MULTISPECIES: hypothetical protein [Rhodomicrobium]
MRALVWAAFAVLTLAAGALSPAQAASRIEWRLENPFRLFKKPEHTELHRQVFESLNMSERRLPILSAERRLEARFGGSGWADDMYNDTCYSRADNRYTACKDYVLPKSHRIVAQLGSEDSFLDLFLPDQPHTGNCVWRLESSGKTVASVTSPCDKPVKLDVPFPAGGRLSVKRDGRDAAPLLEIKIRDVLILGLGDSFGAGEGNPDHPVTLTDSRAFDYGEVDIAASRSSERLDGYPARQGKWQTLSGPDFLAERARWWDRECHRSLYSHQFRAALQLAVEDPKRAITFVSYSCSGAEIAQGILLRTSVRECRAGESYSVPGQLSSASQDLCTSVTKSALMPAAIINRMPELRSLAERDMRVTRCAKISEEGGGSQSGLKRPVDLVLLSVGGNDVGFVPLISDSILSETSIYRTLGQRLNSVYGVDHAKARLDLVKKRFDGLKYSLDIFLGVKGSASDRKVILTGYPNMGYAEDGVSSCDGSKGLEVFPPFRLDAAKVGKADEFTTELNRSLAAIAGRDWTYVDGYRKDFRSRGLCATNGDNPAESLAFPRLKDGVWTPYKPSHYPAYAPRQRWFRTPNDAFLTSNMHAETVSAFGANCSALYTGTLKAVARKYWAPFQIFLASTYGGAFHPTAEGQARIADDVAEAARNALRRTH